MARCPGYKDTENYPVLNLILKSIRRIASFSSEHHLSEISSIQNSFNKPQMKRFSRWPNRSIAFQQLKYEWFKRISISTLIFKYFVSSGFSSFFFLSSRKHIERKCDSLHRWIGNKLMLHPSSRPRTVTNLSSIDSSILRRVTANFLNAS